MTAHSRRFARHCREHFDEPHDEQAPQSAEQPGDAQPVQAEPNDQVNPS